MASAVITESVELTGPVSLPGGRDGQVGGGPNEPNDLAHRIAVLEIDLGICPKPENMADDGYAKSGNDVPPSVAIIEAGATQFSKDTANLIKRFGGAVAVVTAIAAWATGWWGDAPDALRIATIASAAFILGTTMLAVSIIVASDVKARGQGAAAQYHARAQIADAFLRASARSAETLHR